MNIVRSLIDGVWLSIFIGGWIMMIQKINPRLELKSYPPEIKQSVPPQTRQEKKQFTWLALPGMLLMLVLLVLSMKQVYVRPSWVNLYLHAFIAFMVWNVLDLIVMDWLIFCTITPKLIIIPGTEGHAAYKDFRFHFIGFLKGTLISGVVAWPISLLAYLLP